MIWPLDTRHPPFDGRIASGEHEFLNRTSLFTFNAGPVFWISNCLSWRCPLHCVRQRFQFGRWTSPVHCSLPLFIRRGDDCPQRKKPIVVCFGHIPYPGEYDFVHVLSCNHDVGLRSILPSSLRVMAETSGWRTGLRFEHHVGPSLGSAHNGLTRRRSHSCG